MASAGCHRIVSILVFMDLGHRPASAELATCPLMGFQSLFSWISVIGERCSASRFESHGFQSLFSWISVIGIYSLPAAAMRVRVSILVFMDLGHRRSPQHVPLSQAEVSILVFMDLGHRQYARAARQSLRPVSILVFMDLGHRLAVFADYIPVERCFNPCFHGSRSSAFVMRCSSF